MYVEQQRRVAKTSYDQYIITQRLSQVQTVFSEKVMSLGADACPE